VKKILKVNVENPGSGDFLTLGSGMSFFRILDPERLVKIWVKNTSMLCHLAQFFAHFQK
jgi:hypothetical protein